MVVALAINSNGQYVPLHVNADGTIATSGVVPPTMGDAFYPGGVELLQGINDAGQLVPLRVDANGNLGGVGGPTIRELTFVETPGVGTYTASIVLPPNTMLLDLVTKLGPLWAASTLANIGDSGNAGCFYGNNVPLSSGGIIAFASWGSTGGLGNGTRPGTAGPNVFYPTGTTITATIVSSGAGGSAGRFAVYVIYTVLTSTAAVAKV